MNSINKPYLIYKITNNINGKVYIGETCNSLHRRFYEHKHKSSNCVKLKKAFKKYGCNNFSIEEIDYAKNIEEAYKKESYWIKKYNSIKNGYNILSGKYCTAISSPKKVYCVETREIFDTATLCSKVLNTTVSQISGCCCGRRTTVKGKHFCYLDENGNPKLNTIKWRNPNKKKVLCVETGEIFESVKKASEWIKRSDMSIFQCFKGVSKKAGGYHWKELKD